MDIPGAHNLIPAEMGLYQINVFFQEEVFGERFRHTLGEVKQIPIPEEASVTFQDSTLMVLDFQILPPSNTVESG